MTKEALSRRDFLKLGGKIGEATLFFALPAPLLRGLTTEIVALKETESPGEGDWFSLQGEALSVPLRSDWFYNNSKDPVILTLNAPVLVQARRIKTIQSGDTATRYAEIPVTGDPALVLIKLDEKTPTGKTSSYKGPVFGQNEILGGYTFTGERIVKPQNISNILEALINVATFQKEHNGFTKGTYSLLDITHVVSDQSYKYVQNGDKLVKADGVDAVATTLAKPLFPLTVSGRAEIIAHTVHPQGFAYFSSPVSPELTEDNSDARLGPNNFVWSMHEHMYLWTEAAIISAPTAPAKARIMFTLTWRNTPQPESAIDQLRNVKTIYEQGSLSPMNGTETTVSWDTILPTLLAVHPEEYTADFTNEVNGLSQGHNLDVIRSFLNMPVIADWPRLYYALIYHIRDLVREFHTQFPYSQHDHDSGKPLPDVKLGTFLMIKMQDEGIYAQLEAMSGQTKKRASDPISPLQMALRHLNDNTYVLPNQPITCLGLSVLLNGLPVPIGPNAIEGESVQLASGLIDDFTREALKWLPSVVSRGLLFVKTTAPEDVNVGDMFVRYAGNNTNHIGTVIGKKVIEGQTKLLVTDANRKNDGDILVYEVDKDNFRIIFGEGKTTPPIVIRNTNVKS